MTEDFFILIEEKLSKEYKWLPAQSDEMDWWEIQKYIDIINTRNEAKKEEKIQEQIMLLMMIHTSEPNELMQSLQNYISNEAYDDDIGNIKDLDILKARQKEGC